MADKIRDIRTFIESGMQLDKEERILSNSEYRECWNSIVNVSDADGLGCLENIKGTVNVFDLTINAQFKSEFPTGTLRCNGGCKDEQENAIIYFLCDTTTTNHSIIRMYNDTYTCEWIIKAEPLLNFKIDYKIKSANRIGDLLYWTDGYFGSFLNNDFNPPRKINVKKALKYTTEVQTANGITWCGQANVWPATNPLYQNSSAQSYCAYRVDDFRTYTVGDKYVTWINNGDGNRFKVATGYGLIIDSFILNSIMYVVTDRIWTDSYPYYEKSGHILPYEPDMYFGIDWQILDRIKYPPNQSLSVVYKTVLTHKTNNLRGRLFQFRYRYKYDDNEYSVWSDISDVPLPLGDELLSGTFVKEITTNNCISVIFNTGSERVIRIEIAVREGNIGVWKSMYKIEKYVDDVQMLYDDITEEYLFYNDQRGEPIDQVDIERLSDFVPLITKNEILIEKNRLLDSNFISGYDATKINVALTRNQERFEFNEYFLNLYVHPPAQEPSLLFNAVWCVLPDNIDDYSTVLINFYRLTHIAGTGSVPPYGDITGSVFCPTELLKMPGETTADIVVRAITIINNLYSSGYSSTSPYIPVQDIAYGTADPNTLVLKYETIINFSGGLADTYVIQLAVVNINKATPKKYHFKTGTTQFLGIQYYDRALRTPGANTDATSQIDIPYLTTEYNSIPSGAYLTPIHRTTLSWEILNQPPDWAEYYRWVYGKSNVEWFFDINIKVSDIFDDGINTYLEINRNIQTIIKLQRNINLKTYQWQKGDRIRFLSIQQSGVDFSYGYMQQFMDFEILGYTYSTATQTASTDWYRKDESGTSDNYIRDANGNKVEDDGVAKFSINKISLSLYGIVGALNQVVVEIYRPINLSDTAERMYYEIDELRPILNPHTALRAHGNSDGADQLWNGDGTLLRAASGTFWFGDSYIKSRTTYGTTFMCEAMEFSDYFDSKVISIGRPSLALNESFNTTNITGFLFSERFIENSKYNGLSTVLAKNGVELLERFGEVMAIIEVGFTVKVLQKYKPSAIYIGRAGLTQADLSKGEILFANDKTLGTVVVSDSDYGTLHGTSVCKHEKALYWYDINSGCIVRDGANGIFPISDYGVKDFIRDKSRLFMTNGVDVYSVYDEFYNIVIFSFVDQTDSLNDFTIGFHEPTNKWISFYGFTPDWLESMKITTTSFDPLGQLWIHNQGTRMNFYGVQKTQKVTIVTNAEPLKVKVFRSMAVDSNKAWDVKSVILGITDNYKRGMFSLIPKSWFAAIEGKWYSAFGKNMLTNGVQNYNDLINGDELRGSSAKIELENTDTEETKLFGVIINSTYSAKSG